MSSRLEALKAAYEEWGTSGKHPRMDKLVDLMADNFTVGSVYDQSPGMIFAKEKSIAYLTSIFGEWEMISFEPEVYVEQDLRIAMFGVCSWRYKNGNAVKCRIATLWTFDKDDKAVSMIDIFDSAKAMVAASTTVADAELKAALATV
jgi:hypothetical protein